MSLFDYVKCHLPLPVEGANELEFQTKDLPSPWLEDYEIRADGTLWRKGYDTVDRSRRGQWQAEHPGEEEPEWNVSDLMGCLARTNERWEPCNYTGEMRFSAEMDESRVEGGRIEFWSFFVEGSIRHLHQIRPVPPVESS